MMCHADYALYTLVWQAGDGLNLVHNLPGTLKCVDWDSLHEWMLERSTTTDMLDIPHH